VLVMLRDECFGGTPVDLTNCEAIVEQPILFGDDELAEAEVGFPGEPFGPHFPGPTPHVFEPAFSIGLTARNDLDLASLRIDLADIDERHPAASRTALGHIDLL
jgi:hypothetical protein